MSGINDEMVADPEVEPPLFGDEVDWTDEVGDDAEPQGEGE